MARVWIVAMLVLLVGCDFLPKDKPPPEKKAVENTFKELTPEKKLEFAEKCSKSGKAYFVQYRTDNLPDGWLWDEPEYHYSARLNTCLVHIRFIYASSVGSGFSMHDNKVIDIFANKILLQGKFTREKNMEKISESTMSDAPNFTSEEFFKRKEVLFNE